MAIYKARVMSPLRNDEGANTVKCYHAHQVLTHVLRQPLKRIHLARLTKNRRHPLRLNLPKFAIHIPRPLLLTRRPEGYPLSDFALWRASNIYQSFNANRRLGLYREFMFDLDVALKSPTPVSLDKLMKKVKRERLEQAKELDAPSVPKPEDEYELAFSYTYTKVLSRQLEQNPPIHVLARRDALFHRLMVPLFDWAEERFNDSLEVPLIQIFDPDGKPLVEEDKVFNITVGEVAESTCRFASFGNIVFTLTSTLTRRSAEKPYRLRPPTVVSRKCEGCKVHVAELEVTNSIMLPITPSYLCKACYNELHPTNSQLTAHYGHVELLINSDTPALSS
eukprot:Blabericola_migrator_1__13244@NODE_91_length_14555_cov_140_209277_g81_i0_p4_GENE_NODE_91_length_14555_cov_140_209277_g81_i0NODE_91_length_14555_cov_140_209277_g81_i0_p4_ORF_typecomplete_len336_score39_12zfSNAP50_C/PF12251_8/1_9e09CEBP_ZZ/PF16366_5/0_85_NODE_91_length_14555_cov_140_209277_g81_i077158722